MSEEKTTKRMVIVGDKTVVVFGVPEHVTDDEVRTFALMKLHLLYKKSLSAKGKAS